MAARIGPLPVLLERTDNLRVTNWAGEASASDRRLLRDVGTPAVPDEERVRLKFLNKRFTWFRDDG